MDLTTLPSTFPVGWVLAQAVLFLIVAFITGRLAISWSGTAMRRARVDLGTQILVKRALIITWIIVTILSVLGTLGVNPAGLVAVVGTVGLAFGLALQDILRNFFSGIYLLLERPFRVGDTIRVKDQTGVVENIGVRTTRLRTPQNVQILVPNATVFGEVVANTTFEHAAPSTNDGHSEKDQAQTHA